MCIEQHKVEPYKTVRRGCPTIREEIDITPKTVDLQQKRDIIHS